MRLPFFGLLLLIGSVAFLACTNDDDAGSQQSPTRATDEATLEARAAELCPIQNFTTCSFAYVVTAQGSEPGALCVDEIAGTWFWETPGGVPGEPAAGVRLFDPCAQDSTHMVVDLINY